MSRAPVVVRIISDIVWPWCFVGVRNLSKASTESGIPIQVKWEPFFLNPATPDGEGEDITQHLIKKYGPGILSALPRLEAAGRQAGIEFTRNRKTMNTVRCHLLMEYCNQNTSIETANSVMEMMFNKYFEQGINISYPDELLAIARECGVGDESSVADAIQSSVLIDKLKEKESALKSKYRGIYFSLRYLNSFLFTVVFRSNSVWSTFLYCEKSTRWQGTCFLRSPTCRNNCWATRSCFSIKCNTFCFCLIRCYWFTLSSCERIKGEFGFSEWSWMQIIMLDMW